MRLKEKATASKYYENKSKDYKQVIHYICFVLITAILLNLPVCAQAAGSNSAGSTVRALHAFYPSDAQFSEKMQKYIDSVDSLSFAWSMIDASAPEALNFTKEQNGNKWFFYPEDYLEPVRYAKSKGKPIQINIYMSEKDCTELLPYADKRTTIVKAVMDHLDKDITQGEGIYFDGVVIDFEGLRDTGNDKKTLLYEGQKISTHFVQFLKELKAQLSVKNKKLYVAVNPRLYYDGYDYKAILGIADRVILMAHDYEPSEKLTKSQIQQYTGYDFLNPANSPAPYKYVKIALNDIKNNVSGAADLSRVWLQITFDSAQWKYEIARPEDWNSLDNSTLSKEERQTPKYGAIKDRVDNIDGNGTNISYGYNNELQSPYIQYYNKSDSTWNVILYEDSNSLGVKIDLAKAYGLGGISVWSLGNVPDYNDAKGKAYFLDGWNTVLTKTRSAYTAPVGYDKIIKFNDKAVEKAVRDKLFKPAGSITAADLKTIYRLKLPIGVKSLNDLKNLTVLEYLDAQQLGLKDISALGSLTNLRVLLLQRNQISDISTLKKLTKLQVLSLNGNKITSVASLASLKEMRELYLRENKITDITALSSLKKLNILHLGVNSIKSVAALSGLTGIYQLSLDENKLTGIKGLEGLTGLKSLNMGSNKILSIQELKNLKALEELKLQRNAIKDVSALAGLSNLKTLSLNGNTISDISVFAGLAKLEYLYITENKIASLTPLEALTNLKELYVSGNNITDFSPVIGVYSQQGFKCDFKLTQ